MRDYRDVKKFLVVDISDIIRTYRDYPGMYIVFRHYPLQDIIQDILLVRPDIDTDLPERIWLQFEERLPVSETEKIDVDNVDFFFNNLAMSLDEHIRWKVRDEDDDRNYVFESWTSNMKAIVLSTTDD